MTDEGLDPTLRTPSRPGGPTAAGPGGMTAFGRYQLSRRLGSGGMGEVWLGFDPALARPVAIKVLKEGFSTAELLDEARATAKVAHPNVVAVYDVGEHEGRAFIAMEYVEGGSLAEWAREPRSWREGWAMLRAAGEGLAAIHRAGLLHRDFKPANVLVGPDGRPRVSDFGLAAAMAEAHGGSVSGTPLYMAPGLWDGEPPSAGTDVFAFAVSCWEVLAGGPPWNERSLDALRAAQAKGALAGPARIFPRAMAQVLARALAPGAHRSVALATLLRAMDRAAWRRPAMLAVASLVGAALLGLGASAMLEARRCAQLASPERLWSSAQRTALGDVAPATLPLLDDWVARWGEAREDVCLERGAWAAASPGDRALVTRCLETQAQRARLAVSSALTAAADGQRRAAAVAVLTDAATAPACRPDRDEPLPQETPLEVLDAYTLIDLSRAEEALTRLEALGPDAGLEASLARVAALRDLGQHDVARAALDHAELLAEQARDERVRARVALVRAEVLLFLMSDLPSARVAVERARTLVARAGGLQEQLHLDLVINSLRLEEHLEGGVAAPDGGPGFEADAVALADRARLAGLRRFEIDGLKLALDGLAQLAPEGALAEERLAYAGRLHERLRALMPDTPRGRFEAQNPWVAILTAAGRDDDAVRLSRELVDSLSTDPSPRATLRIAAVAAGLLDRGLCVESPRLRAALEAPGQALAARLGDLAFVALGLAWNCEGPEVALALAERNGLPRLQGDEYVGQLLWRIGAEKDPRAQPRRPARFELEMAELHWSRLAAEAALANGDAAGARLLLGRVLELGPPEVDTALRSLETLELLVGVARLQLAVGDPAKGRAVLEQLDALDRAHPHVMARRGRAMLLGALAEATGDCARAAEARRTLEGTRASPATQQRIATWEAAQCG